MMVHTIIPILGRWRWGEMEVGEHEFEASLSYISRPHLKKKKKKAFSLHSKSLQEGYLSI
jgi:hypothetical protein